MCVSHFFGQPNCTHWCQFMYNEHDESDYIDSVLGAMKSRQLPFYRTPPTDSEWSDVVGFGSNEEDLNSGRSGHFFLMILAEPKNALQVSEIVILVHDGQRARRARSQFRSLPAKAVGACGGLPFHCCVHRKSFRQEIESWVQPIEGPFISLRIMSPVLAHSIVLVFDFAVNT